MMKKLVYGLTAAAVLALSVPAIAEETAEAEVTEAAEEAKEPTVFETEDGVLSIEAVSDEWKELDDDNHWFVITDGDDLITIDHLSNGETLPPVEVANEEFNAIYQAFVSTKNEVFIVKGSAVEQEDLEGIMRSISTIKILQYDTKKALEEKEKEVISVRKIEKDYYVTASSLNVRMGASSNEKVIGTLVKGEKVHVKSALLKNGKDTGWMQIAYKG